MIEDRPLTPQEVADVLRVSKKTVYELVKRRELPAYRVGNKFRFSPQAVEVYRTDGTSLAPSNSAPPRNHDEASERGEFVLAGQDILLDLLAQKLGTHPKGQPVLRSYLGSYNGLHALYQGTVQAATAHLWDGRTNQYNTPFLPYVLPGMRLVVIHLALRTVGYYVQIGNPKGFKSWSDLSRTDVKIVNRERGSGMRVLLDERLRLAGIEARSLWGYDQTSTTHLAAAASVAGGVADFALGSEKAARQVDGVEFIPLQDERYEMVFEHSNLAKPTFQALVEIVQSPAFRAELDSMGGYGTSETGCVLASRG